MKRLATFRPYVLLSFKLTEELSNDVQRIGVNQSTMLEVVNLFKWVDIAFQSPGL